MIIWKGSYILMSKKNRKRRSMIAVILLIAFLITGCEDKSVKTDHIIRIGVVTYTQDDPFINAMTDQLKENLKKMETDHMKIITIQCSSPFCLCLLLITRQSVNPDLIILCIIQIKQCPYQITCYQSINT